MSSSMIRESFGASVGNREFGNIVYENVCAAINSTCEKYGYMLKFSERVKDPVKSAKQRILKGYLGMGSRMFEAILLEFTEDELIDICKRNVGWSKTKSCGEITKLKRIAELKNAPKGFVFQKSPIVVINDNSSQFHWSIIA